MCGAGIRKVITDEFSVTPVVMESCWLFSCRQLDSKETYLANVSTRCSSPPQARLSFTLALRRTGASGQNIGKISFFAVKLSTREQSATFQGDNNCYHGLCGGNIIETNTEQINTHICPKLRHNKIPLCVGTIHLIRVGRQPHLDWRWSQCSLLFFDFPWVDTCTSLHQTPPPWVSAEYWCRCYYCLW